MAVLLLARANRAKAGLLAAKDPRTSRKATRGLYQPIPKKRLRARRKLTQNRGVLGYCPPRLSLYPKLEDGTWRTIGTTHGGDSHPDCDEGIYKRTDRLIQWYEEQLRIHGETTIDLTPCFNDLGEWEATRACGGHTKDVRGPYGDWSNHCGEGMPVQKYSATCGKAFDPNEEASTSTNGQPSQESESTGATQGSSGEPNSSSSTAGAGDSPTGNDGNGVPGDATTTGSKAKASFSCSLQPSEPYGAFLTMLAVIMWA